MACNDSKKELPSLSEERSKFTTKIIKKGPAPQGYSEHFPPAGVKEVFYTSNGLKLRAWVSENPKDGKRHPAVVFLHGGWSFHPIDWEQASAFIDAGYVLIMPMLRGENGSPGIYEGFYGEVDDAIEVGKFVAQLDYVDPNQVFVSGHSVGAMLSVLVAMMPSNFKAAAAFSGSLDMERFVRLIDSSKIVFDKSNPMEVRLRNPMAFANNLQIPVMLYAERGGMDWLNQQFLEKAQRGVVPVGLEVVDGNHSTMVGPSIEHARVWFKRYIN